MDTLTAQVRVNSFLWLRHCARRVGLRAVNVGSTAAPAGPALWRRPLVPLDNHLARGGQLYLSFRIGAPRRKTAVPGRDPRIDNPASRLQPTG